jgi:hypothetical protein
MTEENQKVIERTQYTCPICETGYQTKEEAEKCLARGEDFIDLPQPLKVGEDGDLSFEGMLVLGTHFGSEYPSLHFDDSLDVIILHNSTNKGHETNFRWLHFYQRWTNPYSKGGQPYWESQLIWRPPHLLPEKESDDYLPTTTSELRKMLNGIPFCKIVNQNTGDIFYEKTRYVRKLSEKEFDHFCQDSRVEEWGKSKYELAKLNCEDSNCEDLIFYRTHPELERMLGEEGLK